MTDYSLWKDVGEVLHRHGYVLEDFRLAAARGLAAKPGVVVFRGKARKVQA